MDKKLEAVMDEHHLETGMQVASGSTCVCGYWSGTEIPGQTRPPGFSGLQWHWSLLVGAKDRDEWNALNR